MWNSNIKVINKTKLVWMFSMPDLDTLSMSAISCVVWHWLFPIYIWIWSLSISTGLTNHGASSSEKSLAQNFTNHFYVIWSVIPPSPYTAQIFFVCFNCCFTFLEIIKHSMPKCCFFIPSSILKWLCKNSILIKKNLMYADMTAVTRQSNKIALNYIKES